jgi:putative solute:sodium symporter small subunit
MSDEHPTQTDNPGVYPHPLFLSVEFGGFCPGKHQSVFSLAVSPVTDMLAHMPSSASPELRRKVRHLNMACLACWFAITLAPVLTARSDLHLGPWPLNFWVAAQGAVLGYLAIVVVFAWLVNRWERAAGSLSFDVPAAQED